MSTWPFHDPPHSLAITVQQVVRDGVWIHCAYHAKDGCWEFVGLDVPEENDTIIVSLEEITVIDPAIMELADLPLGWHAWRDRSDQLWQRAEKFPDLERYEKALTIRLESEKAKKLANHWSMPQFGLITVMGIVTGGAVLFSAFMTLGIDWYKGLFAVIFLTLLGWIVYGVNQMIKLSSQNASNDVDDPVSSDVCETNDLSTK